MSEFWKPGEKVPHTGTGKKATKMAKQKGSLADAEGNGEVSASAPGDAAVARGTSAPPQRLSLSNSVMNMKFMKRKLQSPGEEQDSQKIRKCLDLEDPVIEMDVEPISMTANSSSSSRHGHQTGLVVEEEEDMMASLPGRRSFGGFNKAVERHYHQVVDSIRYEKETNEQRKSEVSDAEILASYDNLVSLPRGPNQGRMEKRDRNSLNGSSGAAKNSNHESDRRGSKGKKNKMKSGNKKR